MTLDEAIRHCEEVAEAEEQKYKEWRGDYSHLKKIDSCLECAKEHRQLAEWLRKLKKYEEEIEQTSWIPTSEKLPEEYMHVLCQFALGGMSECYLAHGLFHVVGGVRLSHDEVIAWMPLPEPYKAESEG